MTDYSSSPWYQTAIEAANRFGVPSNLFVAQIGQESSFNPNAQNGNASGIAQFMPGTASGFGINPLDPTASLNAAAQYDSQLHTSLGSWTAAMNAYGTTAGGNGQQVAALAQSIDQGSTPASSASSASSAPSVTGLLDIVTDLPRIATILVGLILLIVGLASLSHGPAVIIQGARSAAKKIGVGSVAEAAAVA